MKLTFLGTGTSFGVPVVGCDCRACTSSDPRDRRTRHGAIIEHGDGRLLIDTPPELRLQLLAAKVNRIDAVWFTHPHADHVHGIDDLRVFRREDPLPAYASPEHLPGIASYFPYIFGDRAAAGPRSTIPRIELRSMDGRAPVTGKGSARESGADTPSATTPPMAPINVLGRPTTPVRVPHGRGHSFGLRVGPIGYVTDAKSLPPEAVRTLTGVKVLVLNALWFGDPHPAHFSVEEAVAAAREVRAEHTYLTHLTHRVTQRELDERLPDGVKAAYDGLTVEVPEQ